MKNDIDKKIWALVGQIFGILVFMVASYFLYTNGRVASYASIAKLSSTTRNDLQVSYNKNDINHNKNLLDSGKLAIKNPNKVNATALVQLKVSKNAELNKMSIVVNDEELNLNDVKIDNDYYIINVENYKMKAFEDKFYVIDFYSKDNNINSFNYTYNVIESFLN